MFVLALPYLFYIYKKDILYKNAGCYFNGSQCIYRVFLPFPLFKTNYLFSPLPVNMLQIHLYALFKSRGTMIVST